MMVRNHKVKALGFLFAALTATDALSAGLFFAERGVRPIARGGAFVAGADDLHSIWYNPAGLADADPGLLLDLAWLNYGSEFTRKTRVVDNQGTVRYFDSPMVQGSTPILPIPTSGGVLKFGKAKEFTIAGGMYAPYTAITSFPDHVNGEPAASRYSLVSLDGSLLVILHGAFAYKPIEELRFGAGIQMLTGTFRSSLYMNANPSDRLLSAPEDPAYDAMSQLNVGPIFSPSGNIGVTVVPKPWIRFGASAQLPFWIDAPATVQVRLPSAALLDKAHQEGQAANVTFRLPPIIRFGVEVRPMPELRVELAYTHEFWSMHDNITVTPKDVKLYDITGFPSPYAISTITLPRNFEDSNSVRLGGEYTTKVGGYRIPLRLGLQYESSAIPRPYLSPLTFDSDKVIIGCGGGIYLGKHWRLDASYARVIAMPVDVAPEEAAIGRVSPVAGYPTTSAEKINGGHYSAYANIFGMGVEYKF